MPLNFVDIAQNPSLAIYKIVLVFAFRLVRWDGRWMKWQANHWKCIVQKRAFIPILSTMWLPANKSSERLKEVSVIYLIKKKKTEMMGISIAKEGTWQGSQQAKTLKMHVRCMLSLVPCIYIYFNVSRLFSFVLQESGQKGGRMYKGIPQGNHQMSFSNV